MLSWAIGGLLLATLGLKCYLLLSTMLGTDFRVYSMCINMEINKIQLSILTILILCTIFRVWSTLSNCHSAQ
jgi:hypothetical protein